LTDLESIAGGVGKAGVNGPAERATSGSAERGDSVKVGGETTAQNEGYWLVLGGVGDGVGLSSLNTSGWVGVDGGRESSRHEGSARDNDLEETHVDGSVEIRD
jgi:hypothetical protein